MSENPPDHIADNEQPLTNYEDVTTFDLDEATEAQLIDEQNELVFAWSTADGSPMAVVMSYLRDDDGDFWLTASGQRKRIPAIRRNGSVALVITSPGTSMGPGRTVTYKGHATVLDDAENKAWFYPALGQRIYGDRDPARAVELAEMLDSPRRVLTRVTPKLRVGYDGRQMANATKRSRDAGHLSTTSLDQ